MTRKQAEKNYQEALKATRIAENVSEEAYEAAWNKLAVARTELVATEIAFPTYKEIKSQNELLRLRNRGWDV